MASISSLWLTTTSCGCGMLPNLKPLVKCCFTSNFALNLHHRWKNHVDAPKDKAAIEVVHDLVIPQAFDFAISNDGKTIAVATGTKEIVFLETLTGKLLRRQYCKKIKNSVSVQYSPDGSLLGVGGGLEPFDVVLKEGFVKDGFVEIWKTDINKLVAVLDHELAISCLAISADNKHAVSGGLRGTRVGDRQRQAEVRLQHELPEESVGFVWFAFWKEGRKVEREIEKLGKE